MYLHVGDAIQRNLQVNLQTAPMLSQCMRQVDNVLDYEYKP